MFSQTSFLPGRDCDWCRRALGDARSNARFCSRKCRQSAFRARRLRRSETLQTTPLKFAYADPPYPGKAKECYGDQPTYAGEVDHPSLIDRLTTDYDGWALSTGAYALREILPLCPKSVRVCAWVKPIGVSSLTFGMHNTWEPLIVVPGRRLRPGKRDWLRAMPARGGGELIGRKPIAFCVWMFDLLGMLPGDAFDDLFPGSGIVARTWSELSHACSGDRLEAKTVARGSSDGTSVVAGPQRQLFDSVAEVPDDMSFAAADDAGVGDGFSHLSPDK